jgi:dihydrofolate reductase
MTMKKYNDLHISAICAIDSNNGIGLNNTIPWNSTTDMRFFKHYTMNKIVIMGRNTWESLPRKPLPQRINVVMTTGELSVNPDRVYSNIDYAIATLHSEYPKLDIVVIGGAQLYKSMESYIDEFVITHIPGEYNCDTTLDIDFTGYKQSIVVFDDLNIVSYKK